jgi:hypothetical protein
VLASAHDGEGLAMATVEHLPADASREDSESEAIVRDGPARTMDGGVD